MNEQQPSEFEKAASEQPHGGLLREFWGFLCQNKKWWLLPILILLLLFGLLVIFSGHRAGAVHLHLVLAQVGGTNRA